MLNSGDLVELDLGPPEGREAGFRHPAVVVSAQRILDATPNVIQVVPITTTNRGFGSEVRLEPDADNGLTETSCAQCQHIRSVSTARIDRTVGNIGSTALAQVREILSVILDITS